MRSAHLSGRTASAIGAIMAAMLVACGQVWAQAFPTKPITVVTHSTAGGLADLMARIVADEATKNLGQPVIVINRPGASGKIAMHAMLNAPRDGHTIVTINTQAMTINPLVDPEVGYDPLKDVLPLTLALRTPLVVVVHPSVPARSMRELVAYVRANPEKLAYGSFGNSSHLWTEELLSTLNLSIRHIPYKIEPFLDLLAGRLQFMIASGVSKPHVDAGKLVALATSGKQRWDFFPDLPTYGETGLEELKNYSYSPWLGFGAAADIPDHAVSKLREALVKALHAPAVKSALARYGVEVVSSTTDELSTLIKAELERNRSVLASGRIKLQQ